MQPAISDSSNAGAALPTGRPSSGSSAAKSIRSSPRSPSIRASRTPRRPSCWSSCRRRDRPAIATTTSVAATAPATPSVGSSRPTQATALGPAPFHSATARPPASAPSTPFRASVVQPAGAEWSCPKQWQSGVRPRARLMAIAAPNVSRRPAAASAPMSAPRDVNRRPATASSASGSATASADATRAETPKLLRARREPPRSSNFVTPASPKTAASRSLVVRTAASTMSPAPLLSSTAAWASVLPLQRPRPRDAA